VNFISFGRPDTICWDVGLCLLQVVDLGQQLRSFVLQQSALHLKIFFRVFSGAILEGQIAEVVVELLLALQEKIEPRLLALRSKSILRPERVEEQRDQQQHARDQALCLGHFKSPSISRRTLSRRSRSSGSSVLSAAVAEAGTLPPVHPFFKPPQRRISKIVPASAARKTANGAIHAIRSNPRAGGAANIVVPYLAANQLRIC